MFTFNHVFEFSPILSFIIVYWLFFNFSVTNDNQTELDVKRKIVFVTFIGQFANKKNVEVVRGNQNQITSNYRMKTKLTYVAC